MSVKLVNSFNWAPFADRSVSMYYVISGASSFTLNGVAIFSGIVHLFTKKKNLSAINQCENGQFVKREYGLLFCCQNDFLLLFVNFKSTHVENGIMFAKLEKRDSILL